MGTYGSRSGAVGMSAIVKALDKVEAQGQEDRRPPDGGVGERHRHRERRAEGRRNRQEDAVLPGGARRLHGAQPARRHGAGAEGRRLLRPDQLHLPVGHLHLRGRGRPGDGQDGDRAVRGRRRLRQHHQPEYRRGPGARRSRPGHRTGAAGGRRPTTDSGQLVTGSYMDYTMPRADDLPSLPRRPHDDRVPEQSARHQGLRRGRRDRLDAGGHQRDHRRHRRSRDRHARDACRASGPPYSRPSTDEGS